MYSCGHVTSYLGPTRNCWPLTMVPSPDSVSPPSVGGECAAPGSASAIAADLLPILTIWNESCFDYRQHYRDWNIAFEWMKRLMRLSVFTVKSKNIGQNWWHGFYTNQKLWDGVISVSTTPTFLQWSPNIDWLSTATVTDPSVCLSECQCCLCFTELQCLSPPPAVTLGCSTGLVWLSMARVLTRCGGGRRPDHGAERSH